MTWRDDSDAAGFGTAPAPAGKGPCQLCVKKCAQCGLSAHEHTQAGLVECAWRGAPCDICGCPPHPDRISTGDSTPARLGQLAPAVDWCPEYLSPDDTYERRQLRAGSAWHRDAPGPFYVFRHCNHRRHGKPEPAGIIAEREIAWNPAR